MNTWSYAALGLTAVQGLWCLLCLCRRDLPPQPGETKRFPWGGGFVALSLVLEVVMAAFVVGFALLGAGGVEMLFALFQLLATALVTEACLHVLVLTREGFVIRTHFGRVHTCRWEDVLSCSGDPQSAAGANSLQTKHGRFFLSFLPPTNMALLGMIRAERQKRGLGPLPIRRVSLDPFGGHVRDWQGLVAAYVLVGAMLLAAMGFMLVRFCTPIKAENTQRVTVSFSAWEERHDGRLDLFGQADGMTYRVAYNLGGMEAVKADCGTGAEYEAYIRRATPQHEADYYRVFALTGPDGTPYMTFGHANAGERAEGLTILAFMGVGLAVWAFYVGRSIQVGRHPERYTDKIIRRYFKPGYVRGDRAG